MAVQIEASSLTDDEWFFVSYFRGVYPGAAPDRVAEMQSRVIGMTPAAIQSKLQAALESFKARGVITPVLTKDGQPVLGADGLLTYQFTGKIIVRLTADPMQKH